MHVVRVCVCVIHRKPRDICFCDYFRLKTKKRRNGLRVSLAQSMSFQVAALGGRQLVWIRHVASGSFGDVHEYSVLTDSLRYACKRVDTRGALSLLQHKGSTLVPENEMHMLQVLNHENVIKLVSSWVPPGRAHERLFLFEMCSEDLLHRLLDRGPMDEKTGRKHMAQLLTALSYVHSQQIAHRDVKPENLLIWTSSVEPEVLKLCDFGLAHTCSRLEGCTTFIGSADYLAPEVWPYAAGRTYGFACDIWSCGVVAYALLTAEPPYADDTNPWLRSHGLLVPHARIFQGADPTPYSFIRACMVMGPQGREPPSSLIDLLWGASDTAMSCRSHPDFAAS